MSDEDKIVELLKKLQALKDKGLIDENYYHTKKEELLNAYLSQHSPDIPRQNRRGRSKYYIISIFIIVIIVALLAIGRSLMEFPNTVTVTQTLIKTQIITTTKTPMTFAAGTVTRTFYLYPSFASRPKRITLERTLKSCQFIYYPLQAEKGDEIRVHWESNDESTYIAIGTDAKISKLKSNFCETNIITWHLLFPCTGSGYSGTLSFKIPSSAKWYVIVANGNFGCLYSDCPITVSITIEIT